MLTDKKVVVSELCSVDEAWNKNFSEANKTLPEMGSSFDISLREK